MCICEAFKIGRRQLSKYWEIWKHIWLKYIATVCSDDRLPSNWCSADTSWYTTWLVTRDLGGLNVIIVTLLLAESSKTSATSVSMTSRWHNEVVANDTWLVGAVVAKDAMGLTTYGTTVNTRHTPLRYIPNVMPGNATRSYIKIEKMCENFQGTETYKSSKVDTWN